MPAPATTALTCFACGHVNPLEAETCEACGNALDLERAAQSLADANTQMRSARAAPSKGFTTVNGFGTTLLDYRPLGDGLYRTTRWATAAYIPLAPIGDFVIRPIQHTPGPVRHQYQYAVERREPTQWARVPLAWALFLLAIAPGLAMLLGGGEWLEDRIGGPWTVGVGLLAAVWAGYWLFRLHDPDDAYKGGSD